MEIELNLNTQRALMEMNVCTIEILFDVSEGNFVAKIECEFMKYNKLLLSKKLTRRYNTDQYAIKRLVDDKRLPQEGMDRALRSRDSRTKFSNNKLLSLDGVTLTVNRK